MQPLRRYWTTNNHTNFYNISRINLDYILFIFRQVSHYFFWKSHRSKRNSMSSCPVQFLWQTSLYFRSGRLKCPTCPDTLHTWESNPQYCTNALTLYPNYTNRVPFKYTLKTHRNKVLFWIVEPLNSGQWWLVAIAPKKTYYPKLCKRILTLYWGNRIQNRTQRVVWK